MESGLVAGVGTFELHTETVGEALLEFMSDVSFHIILSVVQKQKKAHQVERESRCDCFVIGPSWSVR